MAMGKFDIIKNYANFEKVLNYSRDSYCRLRKAVLLQSKQEKSPSAVSEFYFANGYGGLRATGKLVGHILYPSPHTKLAKGFEHGEES